VLRPLFLKSLTNTQLEAAVLLDQQSLGGLWTIEGYHRELESPNSDLLVLEAPAEISGLIGLGCLWSILEEAHITVLAIHPQYQRQSLGQILLYGLLQKAQARGLEWATLEVRPSNTAAIKLYQKFGFEEVGRRRRYYQDNGEDALILWRRGLQSASFPDQLKIWHPKIVEQLALHNWRWSEQG
jgi:[ribosomal protein S18]-alanine N-acetyltransferase